MDMQWHLKCYWESEVPKWDWEMQLGFRGGVHPHSVARGQEDTPDHKNIIRPCSDNWMPSHICIDYIGNSQSELAQDHIHRDSNIKPAE